METQTLEEQLARFSGMSLHERIALIASVLPTKIQENAYVPERSATPCSAVPEALKLFHRAVPDAARRFAQNHLHPINTLRVVDEKLQIALESQGVYMWSTDLGGNDPPVFGRFDESDPWELEGPSLSTFLLQFVLFERLATSFPFGASVAWLGQPELERLRLELTLLPFPAWHWPSFPGHFYARRNAIAFESPNDGDLHSFFIGATNAEDLVFMKRHVNAAWEQIDL